MMEAAIHVKPFGFDRVFRFASSEPAAANNAELLKQIAALQAEVDRQSVTHQAELTRARADGFEAGLVQARSERETAVLAATDALHASLDEIAARLSETADTMMRDAAEVALTAADALAGFAVDKAPGRAIDEALGRVLEQIGRGTRLAIRVNPALATEVERQVAARAGQERRTLSISVITDEAIAPGDAVIFWDEGGLAVDAAARRAAVATELRALLNDRRGA
ncbi:FliH/SctL family protein [Sphingomonas cavernae]|uniref:Flagellar assembly protein H n=1 Tax=Sphingomonas cavernae TaxID=2320861 RepID=A0A418W710_9SPHN|nr:FliH/SctL family protein [Sphingomonas cavernae]RJF85757.1 flagellar assembly protein H [Sphingomonas cavernae]